MYLVGFSFFLCFIGFYLLSSNFRILLAFWFLFFIFLNFCGSVIHAFMYWKSSNFEFYLMGCESFMDFNVQ